VGKDAFQEVDITGITLPITKHNYLITQASQIAETVREAFYIARSGRPGPVLIDFCKNAMLEEVEFVYPEKVILPGYRPRIQATEESLKKASQLIAEAQRPVILAGHGVLMAGAMDELRQFADKIQAPVATTLLGIGSFPASHPYSLGMMGMHGEAYCNLAIQNADLIIAMGMRFDDRVTGNLRTYAPSARKIHLDIDPAEIQKNVIADVTLLGDVKTVLKSLSDITAPKDMRNGLIKLQNGEPILINEIFTLGR
jgi:acetolactate synthase-1/2/3 large subunit